MSAGIPKKVSLTRVAKGWIANLEDPVGKGAIIERIDRVRIGNFGTVKKIQGHPGLWEMIVDEGPGYRVYYGEFNGIIVIVLLAGLKKSQKADIEAAGAALRWLKNKDAEEKSEAARTGVSGKNTSKGK